MPLRWCLVQQDRISGGPSHRRRMHNRWRRVALTRRRRRRRRVRVPAAAPKWPRQVRAATPRGRSPARPHTRRRDETASAPGRLVGRSRPGAFKPAACLPSTPTASTPACDAGKPPSARASSKAPTTVMPRASATSIKAPSRRSGGPLRLRLMILGTMLDGGLQRLGQRGTAAQRRPRVLLPASAKRQQPGPRRDTDDAHAVVGTCGDQPGHGGAVNSAVTPRPSTKFPRHATCPARSG